MVVFFCTEKTQSQTPEQEKMITNFYKDLYDIDKDAQQITQKYLYLKKSNKDMNVRLKVIQALIDSFRANNNRLNNIAIKSYKSIPPISHLNIKNERQSDIFAIQNNSSENLMYILIKKNKIESFNLFKKGKGMTFFMTY